MSHKKESIQLFIVKPLAIGLQDFFNRYGRTTIVGSIRREEETVRDIDMVVCPYKDETAGSLIQKLPKEENKVITSGRIMAISVYKYNGYEIPINIWVTSEELEGACIFAFTGPKNYTIGYNAKAKRLGMKLNRKGLIDQQGKLIAGKTEEGIYKALGKEWKHPSLRGK